MPRGGDSDEFLNKQYGEKEARRKEARRARDLTSTSHPEELADGDFSSDEAKSTV